jgi:SPP1 gp7 family putative phage head morphogenesis protein
MTEQKKLDKLTKQLEDDEEKKIYSEYAKRQKNIRNAIAAVVAAGIVSWPDLQRNGNYTKLLTKVNAEIGTLNASVDRILASSTFDQYANAFYQSAYATDRAAAGVKISYKLLNKNVVQRAITNPLSNLAIAKNNELLKIGIDQAITQAFIQGESFPKMAKRVHAAMGEKARNVMTIARTEGHTAANQGKMDSAAVAEKAGVKMVKVWDSTLDSRTRTEHGAMDGQKRKLDEKFSNGLMYPGDPAGGAYWVINCRCAMRQEIDGYSPKVRRIDGEVIEYKTYDEWLKGRS